MIQYCYDDLLVEELEDVWKLLQAKAEEFTQQVPVFTFLTRLREGYLQLWVEPDILLPTAVMVTEITGHGEKKIVRILAFAGKNPDAADGGQRFNAIKKWAFMNGGVELEAICGDAQMRLFSRWGFTKRANVIRLSIKNYDQSIH